MLRPMGKKGSFYEKEANKKGVKGATKKESRKGSARKRLKCGPDSRPHEPCKDNNVNISIGGRAKNGRKGR